MIRLWITRPDGSFTELGRIVKTLERENITPKVGQLTEYNRQLRKSIVKKVVRWEVKSIEDFIRVYNALKSSGFAIPIDSIQIQTTTQTDWHISSFKSDDPSNWAKLNAVKNVKLEERRANPKDPEREREKLKLREIRTKMDGKCGVCEW